MDLGMKGENDMKKLQNNFPVKLSSSKIVNFFKLYPLPYGNINLKKKG